MRIVVCSGTGSNLQAVIDAVKSGALDVEIAAVGANRPGTFGVERSAAAGIPTFVVDFKAYPKGGLERGPDRGRRRSPRMWWCPQASCGLSAPTSSTRLAANTSTRTRRCSRPSPAPTVSATRWPTA